MIMYTVGNNKRSAQAAFTLIELLVVIGIIALLAGGVGLSMRDGNPTAALRSGQNLVIGLISSARGQAALTQSDAMIIVDVTVDAAGNPTDDFLRAVQVVVYTGNSQPNGTWRPVGSPVLLPKGIYIVPPSAFSTGVTLTGTWTTRQSTGFSTTTAAVMDEVAVVGPPAYPLTNAFSGKKYLRFKIFTALGATNPSTAGTLLVAPGKRMDATKITFDNPEMVRGLLLTRYGIPTLINEGSTFDKI